MGGLVGFRFKLIEANFLEWNLMVESTDNDRKSFKRKGSKKFCVCRFPFVHGKDLWWMVRNAHPSQTVGQTCYCADNAFPERVLSNHNQNKLGIQSCKLNSYSRVKPCDGYDSSIKLSDNKMILVNQQKTEMRLRSFDIANDLNALNSFNLNITFGEWPKNINDNDERPAKKMNLRISGIQKHITLYYSIR